MLGELKAVALVQCIAERPTQNGTVTTDAYSRTVSHPKGGEIMIRDAFAKDDELGKSSTHWPALPPMPDPLPEIDSSMPSRSYSYSPYDHQPLEPLDTGHQSAIHSAPLVQVLFPTLDEQFPNPDSQPSTSQANGKRKRESVVLPPLPRTMSAAIATDIAVDDVDEEECARRLSGIRRRLSVERRFEESDDTGRPLPRSHFAAGDTSEFLVRPDQTRQYEEGGQPSLADTADAWSRSVLAYDVSDFSLTRCNGLAEYENASSVGPGRMGREWSRCLTVVGNLETYARHKGAPDRQIRMYSRCSPYGNRSLVGQITPPVSLPASGCIAAERAIAGAVRGTNATSARLTAMATSYRHPERR